MSEIDFSELQEEVMQHWENNGVRFQAQELLTDDPYPIYEPRVMDKFEDILSDPMACINELGYDKISDYIRERQE